MRALIILSILFGASTASTLPPNNLISLTTRSPLIPTNLTWSSTPALVSPKNDTRNVQGLKDPSILLINGTYHVFASIVASDQYSLVYFNFTSFSSANSAVFNYLDQSPLGTGYRAAPQVFFFAPHNLWYLVYQNGNAAYSTNTDIGDPMGWSAPTDFYPGGTPALIEQNLAGGYWVDMWVICDSTNCHLFSSDDNGRLYRSQTPVGRFPAGMSEPVIAMQEARKDDLFEASNVYSIGDSQYLLLVECLGSVGRYFRSWVAGRIEGPWTPLLDTEAKPFLGASNVGFREGGVWTKSISHGEMVREDVDQRLRIRTCGMRFLYQGVDPSVETDYNALPWKLGLVEQVGGEC
jgi:hypothetical protein